MHYNFLKNVDKSWSLFLDRDGVIAREQGDYVCCWEQFEFLPQAIDALAVLSTIFARIIVVTNQQGVALKRMSAADLADIHTKMTASVVAGGGRIDLVLAATERKDSRPFRRKPSIKMAQEARKLFPVIDFKRSIIIGDTHIDMNFGKKADMYRVLIPSEPDKFESGLHAEPDAIFQSLWEFAQNLINTKNLPPN